MSTGKNIWYASISNIIPSIFTYIFWFVTAKIAGAEAIGVASSISSFVIIIATIAVLDMSLGMKRFLGIAISSGDSGGFKQILSSTVAFVALITVTIAILIAIPNLQILEMLGIDRQYTWVMIAMILAMPFQYVFSEALVAALRSENLVMPFLIGSLVRFPLLFGAVYLFHASIMGTIIAYSSVIFITTISFAFYSIRIFQGNHSRATENIASNIKCVLNAGLASWIPHIIYVIGIQLGTLTVLSAEGAAEAGKFYIAMGIFMVALFMVSGINRVTHALIAGMSRQDQQTTFLSYALKIAFMFTMPIAMPLLFFSDRFLGLMGKEFSSASGVLIILISSLPLVIISEMIYYFLYGKGNHRWVLYLGLTGNVPRIILYFVLPPFLGANGAALAWLIGSITQFIISVLVRNRHSLSMQFKKYIVLTAIPMAIGAFTYLVNLYFIASAIIILLGSLLLYVRLGLFTDIELYNLLYAGLPRNQAQRIYPLASSLMRRISPNAESSPK